MDFQSRFCKAFIAGARWLNLGQYRTPPREKFIEPAVYICRHSDMSGPLLSMLNIPMQVHPWSYHVFCEREACRKHCAEYTFSVRYGWNKWVAEFVAWLIAEPFSGVIRSAGSIPVYRNSLKVRETFKLSVEALNRGESLLIFPDVDYTAQEGDAGKLYEGFLMLERLYFRENGKHLPFIPMHLSAAKKQMFLDEPILFRDDVPFTEEKDRVILAMQASLNRMTETHGV